MDHFHTSLQQAFGVKDEDLQRISSFFKSFELQRDTYLTKEGQSSQGLYFINSGFVRIFNYQNNKEITQWISGANYFITDLAAFLFGVKSRWNIKTLSHVSGVMIDQKNYVRLRQEFSDWDSLEKQFIAHCFISLEERVNQLISLSSEERYLLFFENNKELFNHVPQQFLASMLGMSPETLSRIRSKSNS